MKASYLRAVRLSVAMVAAITLAACGTPVFTTVKNGEGRVIQILGDRSERLARRKTVPNVPLETDVDKVAMAVHPTTGELYVADLNLDQVWKLSTAGDFKPWAGHEAGARNTRTAGDRQDAVADAEGNLYVTDAKHAHVARIAADGMTSIIAGGGTGSAPGPATALRLQAPSGLAIAADGDLLLAERGGGKVWRLERGTDGAYTALLVAEAGEDTSAVTLRGPADVAVGPDGTIYIADGPASNAGRILKVAPGGELEEHALVVGTPTRLEVDKAGNLYYLADFQLGVRKLTPKGEISVLAGATLPAGTDADGQPTQAPRPVAMLLGPDDKLTIAYADQQLRRVALDTPETSSVIAGYPSTPSVSSVRGLAMAGGKLLVVEAQGRVVEVADGAAKVAREMRIPLDPGPREKANFYEPAGLVFRPDGTLIVSDSRHARLRAIAPDGTTTVFAGNDRAVEVDGPLATASLRHPGALAIDRTGAIFLEDSYSIRRIGPEGQVTTLFDTNGEVLDLAVGPDGRLYIVVEVDISDEDSDTFTTELKLKAYSPAGAELPLPGADRLHSPRAVGVDPQGRLIVADNRYRDDYRGTTVVWLQPDGVEHVLVATRAGDRGGQVLGDYGVLFTPAPRPILEAGDLTIGPDGTVYFIHYNAIFGVRNFGTQTGWWPF